MKIEFNFKLSLPFTTYSKRRTEPRSRRQSCGPAQKYKDGMPLGHCRNEEIKKESNKCKTRKLTKNEDITHQRETPMERHGEEGRPLEHHGERRTRDI